MPLPTAPKAQYRPAAGVVIFNAKGEVFLGKRAGESGAYVWQFPQGGIDPGETADYAAIRELEEETGIHVNMVTPLGHIDRELFYDFPESYRTTKRTKNWHGQRQSWFAFRFNGQDKDINLDRHMPAEFSEWRWGTLAEATSLIVPFKRKVYAELAREFEGFSHPVK
ncbi:MAG: RNA pyrophosphohydrolase [Maricaulaceae bacterium]